MNYSSFIRNGVVVLAALITFFASFYKLSEAPAIWYDEGFYTQLAMNFSEHGKQVLQVAPNVFASSAQITVGYPLVIPVSISYFLFGEEVLQGRAVMALFIIGMVIASYALIYALFGAWPAALTVLLLATFPMLYGNGKAILGEVPGLLYLCLALLALTLLERSMYRSLPAYIFLGIAAGLCVATKPLFLLVLGAFFFTLLLIRKKVSLDWRGVALGAIAFLICIGAWVYLQFGADTSLSAVLEHYANPYYSTDLLGLIFTNARRFITESTPLYTLGMLLIWSAALFVRRKKRIFAAEIAAFIFCLLVVASYLRIEGWYRYLFPATVISLLFFPASLYTLCQAAAPAHRFFKHILLFPFAITFALSSAQLYQTAFSSYVADYYSGTRTQDLRMAFASFTPQTSVFIYNVPEIAVLLPTKNYYQYLSPLPEIEIGKEELFHLTNGSAEVVIADQDTYTKMGSLFAAYHEARMVDHYVILKKK